MLKVSTGLLTGPLGATHESTPPGPSPEPGTCNTRLGVITGYGPGGPGAPTGSWRKPIAVPHHTYIVVAISVPPGRVTPKTQKLPKSAGRSVRLVGSCAGWVRLSFCQRSANVNWPGIPCGPCRTGTVSTAWFWNACMVAANMLGF